jgi:hypothetical protein
LRGPGRKRHYNSNSPLINHDRLPGVSAA